jgi:6-phosphofructokinase 1
MTSGGDAPGMNAAVRAVVKTAIFEGIGVYAIYQGYQGMVEGGDMIRKLNSDDVGGILHLGGTVIGTARSKAFREREGRLQAARNLVKNGIDNLVVIGGDGSLTGANLFREEWAGLLRELQENEEISEEEGKRHPALKIVGLVGSIDNDMSGTDITIGTDTALRRIADAADALHSTAASHQRIFVLEVMGRNCGYLALISAISTGADFVLIPEHPPMADDWREPMIRVLREGKKAGKRHGLVILSEGAIDKHGKKITGEDVVEALREGLEEEARLTILGHVQRGGAPSAFDRYMSTVQGYEAVQHLLRSSDETESKIIGMQRNTVTAVSLVESVENTRSIAKLISSGDFAGAIALRGGSFGDYVDTFKTLAQAFPKPGDHEKGRGNILVLNADSPAPGMNKAIRSLVRLGLDKGYSLYGAVNSFEGLIDGKIKLLGWMDVEEWTSLGGSALGTNKNQPQLKDFYAMAKHLEKNNIHAMIVVGGAIGYKTVYELMQRRNEFTAFDIPMICLPASIHNNLPGTDFSIGSDSALNNIVEAVDKIKESAVATTRTFVVEVFGRYCGFLSVMSGLATGAERIYTHEGGITLKDLQDDVRMLVKRFKKGKRLGLIIRNQFANTVYTTPFISALYEEEGGDVFDVRTAILGHLQQGGVPSTFDRALATRMAIIALQQLEKMQQENENQYIAVGLRGGHKVVTSLEDLPREVDLQYFRPRAQWWMGLKSVSQAMNQ